MMTMVKKNKIAEALAAEIASWEEEWEEERAAGWRLLSIRPAPDAREQLRRWDNGDSIWSIEMGGIGPGYEQAIQVLAIEIVRDEIDKPLPQGENEHRVWGDSTVTRVDHKLPDGSYACGGFSGAQVGAAKTLAYQWLTIGPAACLESMTDKTRHIQVSNFWPHVPK
jgi:hypothetical protein